MDFTIKSGVTKMNFNKITEMLTSAGKEVTKESVMKGALHSEAVVGAFDAEGVQIAYARALSDAVSIACITDICVEKGYAQEEIAAALINEIISSRDLASVQKWLIIDPEAKAAAEKCGFKAPEHPETILLRPAPKG